MFNGYKIEAGIYSLLYSSADNADDVDGVFNVNVNVLLLLMLKLMMMVSLLGFVSFTCY